MLQFIIGGYHQGLLQIGLAFGIFVLGNGEVSWSM